MKGVLKMKNFENKLWSFGGKEEKVRRNTKNFVGIAILAILCCFFNLSVYATNNLEIKNTVTRK